MYMAGIPCFAGSVLRHERNGLSELFGDLLRALFEKHVHVGHRQRFIVHKIDLMLTSAPFALAALDRHPRSRHAITDGAHEWFIACGLHDVVIDPVITRWHKVTITTHRRGVVGLIKKVKLQLAGAIAGEALFRKKIELVTQNRTWRFSYERTAMVNVVANNQRRPRLPR